MKDFDELLRRTIKAILNEIRMTKEENRIVKSQIDVKINESGDK